MSRPLRAAVKNSGKLLSRRTVNLAWPRSATPFPVRPARKTVVKIPSEDFYTKRWPFRRHGQADKSGPATAN